MSGLAEFLDGLDYDEKVACAEDMLLFGSVVVCVQADGTKRRIPPKDWYQDGRPVHPEG